MIAAEAGFAAVVRTLLDNGAALGIRDNHQRSALDLAQSANQQEVIAILAH